MKEDTMQTVTMNCADCGMVPRVFEQCGMAGANGDKPDYVCTHCGWMQTSPAAGAAELCDMATWHDVSAYARYRDVARAGGYSVPDEPKSFEACSH